MRREMAANTDPEEWEGLQEYEALQNQLQDLTLQHGYGKLPLDGSILDQRPNLLL